MYLRPIKLPGRLGLALACTVLAGCAGQQAYRNGQELIAQNLVVQGLAQYQEAIAKDPQNVTYRAAYLQTRERAVTGELQRAERYAHEHRNTDAEALFQQVLQLDEGNERALTGLRNLAMDQRHAAVLEKVATLGAGDADAARRMLATLLAENPQNEDARARLRALNEAAAQTAPKPLELAFKQPIRLEFRDAPLRQIFDVIARTAGINFVFDKDIKPDQRASIFLRNSSIESALHFLLLTNQLEQQVFDGNTILVYPNTPAKLKDYQEMIVRTFFLTNADAKTVAQNIKSLTKSRDVVVDEKLNIVIVRDSAEAIRMAEKLVALQDVPEPEVMLEVEILEIKRTRLLELGIRWPTSLEVIPLPLGSAVSTTQVTSLADLRHQNSSTLSARIGSGVINARAEDADVKLLANPRVRARNHAKAKIFIGDRLPNITTTATATGFVAESINYVDVGLALNVEPVVYLDNDVGIQVSLEVNSIVQQLKTAAGSTAYQIGTRTANTVLRLKNGETQVLAGLINNDEHDTGNKVPGLGEIPLLGRLFGSGLHQNEKTEIVLSITPHVIRNIERPEASLTEFRSGTESAFRGGADGAAGVSAGAAVAGAGTQASGVTATPQAPGARAQNPATLPSQPANLSDPIHAIEGRNRR